MSVLIPVTTPVQIQRRLRRARTGFAISGGTGSCGASPGLLPSGFPELLTEKQPAPSPARAFWYSRSAATPVQTCHSSIPSGARLMPAPPVEVAAQVGLGIRVRRAPGRCAVQLELADRVGAGPTGRRATRRRCPATAASCPVRSACAGSPPKWTFSSLGVPEREPELRRQRRDAAPAQDHRVVGGIRVEVVERQRPDVPAVLRRTPSPSA